MQKYLQNLKRYFYWLKKDLSRLFCWHDWQKFQTINITTSLNGIKRCTKCGKFK